MQLILSARFLKLAICLQFRQFKSAEDQSSDLCLEQVRSSPDEITARFELFLFERCVISLNICVCVFSGELANSSSMIQQMLRASIDERSSVENQSLPRLKRKSLNAEHLPTPDRKTQNAIEADFVLLFGALFVSELANRFHFEQIKLAKQV